MDDAPKKPDNTVRSEQSDTKALALYNPYGWRGQIGLICPSTNTSIEPEFRMLIPDGFTVHTARAFQDGPQEPALYRQIAENVALASRDLGSAQVDVIDQLARPRQDQRACQRPHHVDAAPGRVIEAKGFLHTGPENADEERLSEA